MIEITLEEQNFLSKKISWFGSMGKPWPDQIMSLKSSAPNALHFYHSKSKSKQTLLPFDKDSRVLVSNLSQTKTLWKEIFVDNPRLEMAKFSRLLRNFRDENTDYKVQNGAWIARGAKIGANCVIQPGAVIGSDVVIGDYCKISSGVTLQGKLRCGKNCCFHPGSIIGTDGFGYSMDNNFPVLQIAHLGGVEIGNNVDIGPSTTISAGTIDPTYIGNDVKIDGNVYIGHNAFLSDKVVVIAGAVIGGSSHIGSRVWLHSNSVIKTKVRIGSDSIIGVGSVVVKNVVSGDVIMGSVAENIRKKLHRQASINNLLK
jgi:UDP-3-O-[3-hydroxymyristoyl] glucosamine N-acyltransferase LpxD